MKQQHMYRAARFPLFLSVLVLLPGMTATAQQRYWEALTLFGGTEQDTYSNGFLYDTKRDHILLLGKTLEHDLPTTPDAMRPRMGAGDEMDGFIAVFNTDCSELLYCSYIGGSKNDALVDAILLDDDRILITVGSYSKDLPVTGSAWNAIPPGEGNIWFAVLSLADYHIIHSGYFGGSRNESVEKLLLLRDGSIVATGHAASKDLPVTPNAFQRLKAGTTDSWDAFIAIFDSTFNLTFCSYHGGKVGAGEDAWRGLVETDNYIVFAGTVLAPDMPVTDNAYQKSYGGGYGDAYLVAISKDSLRREYSTYLGGSEAEFIHSCIHVGEDRVAIVGSVRSADFPVTPNAWQREFADTLAGAGDGLLGVFSLERMVFEHLTFFGGGSYDGLLHGILDPSDRTVLAIGFSQSSRCPLLPPKTADVRTRGMLVRCDPRTMIPVSAVPVVDVAHTFMTDILKTNDGRTLVAGESSYYTKGGEIPVRPMGHKTVRTGNRDLFIAEVFETPVSVENPPLYVPSGGDIAITPNPACKKFRFSTPGEGTAEVMLYDLLGRRVLRRTVSSDNGTVRGVLNTASLQPGCYLLVVRTGKVLRTGKVVITR